MLAKSMACIHTSRVLCGTRRLGTRVVLFWRGTRYRIKIKRIPSLALSLPAWTNHLDSEHSFSVWQQGQKNIQTFKSMRLTVESIMKSWIWEVLGNCKAFIYILQKPRGLYFHVIYGQEVILFWSHTIITSCLCLHVLFCVNIVAEVNNVTIATWLCLCWRPGVWCKAPGTLLGPVTFPWDCSQGNFIFLYPFSSTTRSPSSGIPNICS